MKDYYSIAHDALFDIATLNRSRDQLQEVALTTLKSIPAPGQGAPVAGSVPDEVLAAAQKVVEDLDGLISDSAGVYGLHLNGDAAPWSDLVEGGRYEEWLCSLEWLRKALAQSQPAGHLIAQQAPSAPGDAPGWLSISTAPKDGTRVILGCDGSACRRGFLCEVASQQRTFGLVLTEQRLQPLGCFPTHPLDAASRAASSPPEADAIR